MTQDGELDGLVRKRIRGLRVAKGWSLDDLASRCYLSPSTREAAYAIYVDTLRRRIELRGTENFPTAAGKKLYGELKMTITINHDGKLLDTVVDESSGDTTLDRRAKAIVHSIGNFGKFTDAMRKETDQIVLQSRFKFTRDETIELSSQ